MQGERLLVVDDESGVRASLAGILGDEGWDVDTAESGEKALDSLKKRTYRAIFLDVWLPGIDGLETLRQVRRMGIDSPVVMISGHGTIETAVRATRSGAYDFIEKPLSLEKILLTLRNALRQQKLERQSRLLKEQLRSDTELIGASQAIRRLRSEVEQAAPTDARVLIYGENGTGKELAARLLHSLSRRAEEPFVAVNCAAIPTELLESEMFGHLKGAFTGAGESRKGKFQLAHEGTLLLDEVADMNPVSQAKLLRVLEEEEVTPVGGSAPVRVDVRVIAATNRTLEREISEGRFREDLFFRLNVVPLVVPPLRERAEDIPELIAHFLGRFCTEYGRERVGISEEALAALSAYRWPGNVRELKNLMERLVIMVRDEEIGPAHLPAPFGEAAPVAPSVPADGGSEDGRAVPTKLRAARERFERDFIRRCLEDNGWNVSRSAERLGLERSNLYRKMKAYRLKAPAKRA